jgi:hypothetical protein
MKRENEDLSFRQYLANFSGGFQTVEAGHADVHDHDIRLMLRRQTDRFSA